MKREYTHTVILALIPAIVLVIVTVSLTACGSAVDPTPDSTPKPTLDPTPRATATPPHPTITLSSTNLSALSQTKVAQDVPSSSLAAASAQPDGMTPEVGTTENQRTTEPASTDGPISSPPLPTTSQHTVQRGETLLGLAQDYGVSMASIQLANDMRASTNLVAGQTLVIPSDVQWPKERPFWVLHVVQAGETLIGLADTYNLSVEEILRVNAIADPTLIQVNQPLVLPLTQLVSAKTAAPTATSAAVAAAPASANPEPVTPTKPPTTTPKSETAPTIAPPAGEANWSDYILARINQARAEHGLPSLTIAPELTHAAQAHAQDCAQRGWGSHVGSDGAVLKTRLERAGYFGDNWGENWVQALNAPRAFEWWYGEIPPNDPHRRNILSPRYTEIGIGIAKTDWGYIFITDFGRR